MSQENDMRKLFPYSTELQVEVSDSLRKARIDSLVENFNKQFTRKKASNESFGHELQEWYDSDIYPRIKLFLLDDVLKNDNWKLKWKRFDLNQVRIGIYHKLGQGFIDAEKRKMQAKLEYLDSINNLYEQYRLNLIKKEEKGQKRPN